MQKRPWESLSQITILYKYYSKQDSAQFILLGGDNKILNRPF